MDRRAPRNQAPWRAPAFHRENRQNTRTYRDYTPSENERLRARFSEAQSKLQACEDFHKKAADEQRRQFDDWVRNETARHRDEIARIDKSWRQKQSDLISRHKRESRDLFQKWLREKAKSNSLPASSNSSDEQGQRVNLLESQLKVKKSELQTAYTPCMLGVYI